MEQFSEASILKCRFQGSDGLNRERLLWFQKQRLVHQLLLCALPVRAARHLEQHSWWLPFHSKQGIDAVIASSSVVVHYIKVNVGNKVWGFLHMLHVVAAQRIAKSVGDWYFDRAEVKAIDCPYPCDGTCRHIIWQDHVVLLPCGFGSVHIIYVQESVHHIHLWDRERKWVQPLKELQYNKESKSEGS